jgi:outer membrane protein insertion porin family
MYRKTCLYLCLLVVLGEGCSPTRRIPAGDALYTGAKVVVEDSLLSSKKKSSLRSDLSSLTRPKPNTKFLGRRIKLFFYNLAGNPKKKHSPAAFIKNKLGEPPVLLSDVNLEHNIQVLQSTLENRGYFQAFVQGDTLVKNKKASATYTVHPGIQYSISQVQFPKDSSVLEQNIAASANETLLKPGEPFDLAMIKNELARIDNYLKERGFYYFTPDYLILQTDSTIGNNKVNLYVRVKPATPASDRELYTINKVFIYPNYRLNATNADTSRTNAVYYKKYYVVDKRKVYKPQLFERSMQFEPGDVYNRTDHGQTINRLASLGVFKFVKNRFEIVPGIDSPKLNAYYYLTSLPKKSLRAEINASTKSNNLTGSSITIGFRNRNTFRGGELFTLDLTGGFEVQFSGQLTGYNTTRIGAETNLFFPKFLTPGFTFNPKGNFVPRTKLLLGYDILNKAKLYTMNSFRGGLGYVWKQNLRTEHQFNPIAINYVQPVVITQLYLDSAAGNPTLLKAVEKQFILGSSYNYNYDQLLGNAYMKGIYFNGNIDLSGNIAGIVSGANAKGGKTVNVFGAPFAQYVRLEGDLRHYTKISKTTVWANRLIVGLGYPYGNSTALPFIKQFFVGGTNSIRAFRSRSLGPGTYKDTMTSFLPDQSGDIKLEMNTELRAKLFSIVYGALFVDAGNIWLYNSDTLRPGGTFTKKFLNELAVGAGAGLRFDVTFLVIRFDVAFPLRIPYLPAGQRWVTSDIRFGDRNWRKQNLVFNLGIGYPF